MTYRLMLALLLLSCGDVWAAEICVDKGEFSQAMQRWQIDQAKLKVYGQKDATQAKLIAELKAHMAEQETQITAGEKYKAAAEPLLAEYASQLDASITRTEELETKLAENKKREWIEVAEIVGVTLLARGFGGKVWQWGKALRGRRGVKEKHEILPDGESTAPPTSHERSGRRNYESLL